MPSKQPSLKAPSRAGLSRRPLTSSKADQALFVNRSSEVRTILSAVELRLNTFVTGSAGSGKTSLLRHVERTMEASGTDVVYVNVEAAQSIGESLELLARAINAGSGVARSSPSAIASDETGISMIEDAAEHRVGTAPLVLLVDGASELVTVTLFGRYRDRLWESPDLIWVAASRQHAPSAPADAFFDRVIKLAPLTQVDSEVLLEARAPWLPTGTRARLVAAIGPAQPVFWMLAAQSLAIGETEAETVIAALTAQRDASRELPDRLRTLHEALVELGPVHAGDERLLERVGVSRPWMATGLKELEVLGLVQSHRDGRRVVYEPIRNWLVHAAAGGATEELLTKPAST